VLSTGEAEWTLSLRIPAWARASTLDGEPVAPGGYAALTRRWRAGDTVVLEVDVSPRLTAPSPRIDAVRGCVALERGPIVYCVEQQDVAGGADLADIAVDAESVPVESGPVEQLGGLPGVALAGVVRELDGWRHSEYLDLRAVPAATPTAPTRLLAVPYFAWANRDEGGMRVWIPAAD
jgi:uncharacterized protein